MKKLALLVILVILMGALFVLWRGKRQLNHTSRPKIVATLFPLYDFTRQVGGDKVDVILLMPPGIEAHAFEPKPSDVIKINESSLFLYTGKDMEPWVDAVLKGITNKNMKVLDASTGVKMLPAVQHKSSSASGARDPHIWLDFDNDEMIVREIAQLLVEIDRPNADYYLRNAQNYIRSLKALDTKYNNSLQQCVSREIVYGGHYAFGYLVARYNLQYLAAQGIAPDSEPTARDLANLVDQIRKKRIAYIFYEELSSPKIAETLAQETQAKLLLLNAAHNISKTDFEKQTTFMTYMEKNLANLILGLACVNKK